MPTVYEAKVRRVGNSLAVIVPDRIAKEIGAREGDRVKISLLASKSRKPREVLTEYAGIDAGAGKFERDERVRV
jgi:antitoxin component of MazEF toxin-antitoxin module